MSDRNTILHIYRHINEVHENFCKDYGKKPKRP